MKQLISPEQLTSISSTLHLDWDLWRQLPIPGPLCIIDLETTGLKPGIDHILELSLIKISPLTAEIELLQTLVKPPLDHIPMASTAIHGINSDMLTQAPSIHDIRPLVRDFVRHCTFLGHQLRFDLSFLLFDLMKGLTADATELNLIFDPIEELQLSGSFFDTLQGSKKMTTELADLWRPHSHRLETLARHIGFHGRFHRAFDDTLATLALFNHFIHWGQEREQLASVLDWMRLPWSQSHANVTDEYLALLRQAIAHQYILNMSYQGGSRGPSLRPIQPVMLFPGPRPSQLLARCLITQELKYFLISKIRTLTTAT